MFQFDLYSYSELTVDEIIQHLNEFDLISYDYIHIDRNGKMKIIETKFTNEKK